MLQLNENTISAADDIILGNDKFKIIESPGEIIFYDAERDQGFSVTGDIDNAAIKKDILEYFNGQYEREGALDLRIEDISKHIWLNKSDNAGDEYYGIYRIEGAYLKIPGNQEDVWIRSDDEKYSSGLDETLTHTFGNTAVKFGIMYPLSEEKSETAIVFKREPDGPRLSINVKEDIDTAKVFVENAIKHFDKEQDIGILDINNYLKSQKKGEDLWIINDKQYPSAPDQTLKHSFGDTTVKFGIKLPVSNVDPVTVISINDIKYDLNGGIDTAENVVQKTIINFDKKQNIEVDTVSAYLGLQIMELNVEAELKNPHSHKARLTNELAKKAGYVQGVCECVAAIGDDHILGKKLLSEMNVTKDMAKKYANPETYKALEQGIFAPQQKLEQAHSIKR